MSDTTTLELTLFQHADGRSVAAQPGAAFLAGDHGWHRAFPVTVHLPADATRLQDGATEGLSAQQRIDAAEPALYDIAAVLVALDAMGRQVDHNLGDAFERLASSAHKRLLDVISELVG